MITTTRLCVGFFAFLALATTANATPKGAVNLSSDKLFQSGSFHCGYVRSKWIPGRMLSRTLFYSHAAEKKNVLADYKKAKGKKKAALLKKSKALQKQTNDRASTCAGGRSTSKKLRFNLAGAVGLALKSTSTSSLRKNDTSTAGTSNLEVVSSDGSTSSAVSSGTATISKFLIAPNDQLYVLFSGGINLDNTSSPGTCFLAKVDKSNGEPTCIESEFTNIVWDYRPDTPAYNKPIQFDAAGAIYYRVRVGSRTILRKYLNGTASDLISDDIFIENFLVADDGSIYLSASNVPLGRGGIYRILQGSLQEITSIPSLSDAARFLRFFPDGKIYIGFYYGSNLGIYRLSSEDGQLESSAWWGYLTDPFDGHSNPTPINHTCITDGTAPHRCGAGASAIHRTPDGKMYAVSEQDSNAMNKILWRYYPSFAKPALRLVNIKVSQVVLTNLVLAGINSEGANALHLFNTSDDSSIELIGAGNEIEIYHLNFIAADNKIMFDGLRFSDNEYVLGQYDLETMTFSASKTGSPLEDFQTF